MVNHQILQEFEIIKKIIEAKYFGLQVDVSHFNDYRDSICIIVKTAQEMHMKQKLIEIVEDSLLYENLRGTNKDRIDFLLEHIIRSSNFQELIEYQFVIYREAFRHLGVSTISELYDKVSFLQRRNNQLQSTIWEYKESKLINTSIGIFEFINKVKKKWKYLKEINDLI